MKRSYVASEKLSGEEKLKVEKELELGYMNLSELLFDQARINFLLALQYDSSCADAYWGLILVKFQLKSEDELFENPLVYKDVVFLKEYERAMQFANENQKNIYNQILERIYAVNEGDKY